MPESKTTTNGGAPMHAPDTKPAWKLSYAFDLPHYADFVIDADTEAEAERIAQALLYAGTLSQIMGEHAQACWDNSCNERVFTSGPDDEDEEADRLPYYAKLNGIKLPEDWQTPPAAEPATAQECALDPDKRLAQFGAQVLAFLDARKEWDSGTPDEIAGFAYDLKLADTEGEHDGEAGFFRALPMTQAPDPAALLLEKIARFTPYSDGTPSSEGLPPDGEDAMRVLNHLIAEARALTSKGGALRN